MVFDSGVRFHYTGANSVDLSTLRAALENKRRAPVWSILDEKPHHYSSTTNVPQADLAHLGFWPLNWVTERKQREKTRAGVKRDTGRVPFRLDAILHGPGVTFPLIQSQEVHISPAGFDHSSVDSCSADTGALDMKRQKSILLVGMLSSAILS